MAESEIPPGHQIGQRWCLPCYTVVREPLEDCPNCDGLLHRIGNDQVCDKCNKKCASVG